MSHAIDNSQCSKVLPRSHGKAPISGGNAIQVDAGSYRDPGGFIFLKDGKVFRAIGQHSLEDWNCFLALPLFQDLQRDRLLIPTHAVDVRSTFPEQVVDASMVVVEHERIPFVSYPYEWPFGMLKDAALLHLDILERCLSHDLILKDSSAFNVQYIGAHPIFIDVLSFARLNPGEPWIGYNQFCKMFLFPLMLQAYKQVPFQNWLRSELEGLDPVTFSHLLSIRDLLRPGVLTHVSLQAWMQKRMAAARYSVRSKIKSASLPKSAIANNIRGLRRVIHKLSTREVDSAWVDYTQTHSYSDVGMRQKEDFVRQVVAKHRHRLVWDLGCNVGHFSRVAAEHADYVVAMDADHLSVETLYRNLRKEHCQNILPLVMNLANISPSQGWAGSERQSLPNRGKPDLALCLALIHHMAISANIPVESFIAWLASLETSLIIEFVGKEDPMVQRLLLNKDDTYDDYNRPFFERCLDKFFRVERSLALAGGTRYLYHATPLINS
jgi:SAM-dependent methyltransferase